MKVLVADDESVSRRLLESAVAKMGYQVESVQDGETAWVALENIDPPRLAVVDWNMPGIDGPTLCKKLRERRFGPYVYTVLLTSRDTRGDVVSGLDAGADDYVVKPFDMGILRARLKVGERMVRLQIQNEQSRAYLAAAMGQIDSGVMLVDGSGRILLANEVLAQLVGVPVDSASGMKRAELLELLRARAAEGKEAWAELEGPSSSRGRKQVELELVQPERRIVRWSIAPVDLPEGRASLESFRDITAEVSSLRDREKRASTDPVTGLMSRRGGEEALERLLLSAQESGHPLSLAMLDIDRFKRFNDSHGHEAGDKVLREVSRAIQATVRGSDLVVRWGGEEILVALPHAQLENAVRLAGRIRAAVEALKLDPYPSVTVSIGVDQFMTGETDLQGALRRADKKLYQAKADGRNRVC